MGTLGRFGLDVLLAVAVAAWFAVTGIIKLSTRPAGRRSVGGGGRLVRTRGLLELIGAIAVAGGAAISLTGLRLPFPGMAIGLVLALLAAWTVVDAIRPKLRWLPALFALIGFALAVFYAGFRE